MNDKKFTAKWTEVGCIDALDATRFEVMQDEISRRAKLLSKRVGLGPFGYREFARACVMRVRDLAISALRAAGMEFAALEAASKPDLVADACDLLRVPTMARAEQVGASAIALQRGLARSKSGEGRPVGPLEEQTQQALRDHASAVFENVVSVFDATWASEEAMRVGSAFQTLRLAYGAASMISEPRAPAPRTGAAPEDIEAMVAAYREASVAETEALVAAMETTWTKESARTRAATVAVLTAAAGVQATATDFFARVMTGNQASWPPPPHRIPVTSPLSENRDFAQFLGGGVAELRWQAECLREIATLPHDQRASARYS